MGWTLDARDLISLVLMLFLAAIFFIAFSAVKFGRRIESKKIPMQWGADDRPTWFAPRLLGVWFQLYFLCAIGGVLFALTFFEPEKIPVLCLSIILVSATTAAAHLYHLKAVVRWEGKNPT
jgi:apolipoprotein N-acyltransferase